jgi:hypothetical protein
MAKLPSFKVPQFDIEFLVNREHVGAPDEAIAALIIDRCQKAGMVPEQIAQCVQYALRVHAGNRELYSSVMNGSPGQPRGLREMPVTKAEFAVPDRSPTTVTVAPGLLAIQEPPSKVRICPMVGGTSLTGIDPIWTAFPGGKASTQVPVAGCYAALTLSGMRDRTIPAEVDKSVQGYVASIEEAHPGAEILNQRVSSLPGGRRAGIRVRGLTHHPLQGGDLAFEDQVVLAQGGLEAGVGLRQRRLYGRQGQVDLCECSCRHKRFSLQ